MARIKDQGEASTVTVSSKNRRWSRLASLFSISRLDQLFPENSTPNNAGDDHLKCSGDVLRDLCMIGEELTRRGMTKEQMRSRVKRSFTPGIQVKHADVRELLDRVKYGTMSKVTQGIDTDYFVTLQQDRKAADPMANMMNPDTAKESPAFVHQSIEEASEPAGHLTEDVFSRSFNMFDQTEIEIDGPRKAKAKASQGIMQGIESEMSSGEYEELEHEEDDVIPAQPRTKALSLGPKGRALSSLRTMEDDGFADAYIQEGNFIPKPKSRSKNPKRKSAPSALETNSKRARSAGTPSSNVYEEKERDTLVSCLRMTQNLLAAADQSFEAEDMGGAQRHVGIVLGMVDQVLARYTEQ